MGTGCGTDFFDQMVDTRIIKVKKKEELRVDHEKSHVFAVGAARGNVDLLKGIIERIELYPLAKNDKVVFLGDNLYGHTPSHSANARTIIKILREYQEQRPEQVIVLRGQDEQKLAMFKPELLGTQWGKAWVNSYRCDNKDLLPFAPNAKPYLNMKQLVLDRKWLQNLPTYYKGERYYFVNKGLDPMKSFYEQQLGSVMFIDHLFDNSQRVYDKGVVYTCINHQPVVKLSGHKIGIGSNSTDLSCGVLINNPPVSDSVEGLELGKSFLSSLRVGKVQPAQALNS